MLSIALAVLLVQTPPPLTDAAAQKRVEEFFTAFDDSDESDMRPRDLGLMPTYHGVAATKDGGFVAVGSGHDLGAMMFRRGFVVKYAADGVTIERMRGIGGSGSLALAVAVGSDGRVAVAGTTQSATFPSFHAQGAQRRTRSDGDPFVVVFSPDLATVELSLAFGGGGADIATSIAFDSKARIYVAGGTESADAKGFESANGAGVEANRGGSVFLVRIEDGSLRLVDFVATNCLSPAYVACSGSDVALAGVEIAGAAQFPTRRFGPCGASDCFVSRYDVAGKRRFLVALGGTQDEHFAADALIFSPPQLDEMCEHAAIGGGLAIDTKGRAVICGCTESVDLPSTYGAYQTKPSAPTPRSFHGDGFVAIVDAEGNLARATYLSTDDVDEPGAIAVARNGKIVIGGRCHDREWIDGSRGSDGYEGFVLRLDADLTRMIGHAGFLGGGYQWVDALAIDRESRVIAVGGSNGTNADAVEFDATKPRRHLADAGWHAIAHRFE